MSIKIAGIQLVLINLHDTRCAQRGEVSQREAPSSTPYSTGLGVLEDGGIFIILLNILTLIILIILVPRLPVRNLALLTASLSGR